MFKKILKHLKKPLLVGILIILLLSSFVGDYKQAEAATYTWTQASWAGGTNGTAATHDANRDGLTPWTYYSSASSTISAGANLTLSATSGSVVQTNDGTTNTGFNRSGRTFSQTEVTGTEDGASVTLAVSTLNWTASTLDSTGDVGYYTSIVLDSNNKAHISYYDTTNYDLKYATNSSGSWVYSTLDSTGNVGSYTSIVLDSNNKAHISYRDNDNYDLKYATNSSGSWVYSTLDSTGDVGYETSIALDSNNKAHISYNDGTNLDLKYATNSSGSWVYSTLDSTGNVGSYTSIVLDSNNKAHISYYDTTNTNLKYATDSSGSWVYSTLDSTGNVGSYTSIALDSNNKAHISYYDTTNTNLKYATNSSGSWVYSTLDSTGNVGSYTSIALDSNNEAHISYYDDIINYNLKYIYSYSPYYSSGTFTSGVIDPGFIPPSWGNLSWTESGTGTITMKARSCSASDCSGATDWASCTNITSGSALSTGGCVTNGHQYVQYQASLSGDTTTTPSLDDVTVGYNIYDTTQVLTSSKYNTSSDGNVVGGIKWDEDASLPTGTTVTASLRTASSEANLDSSSWTDFTNATANCSKTTGTVTCTAAAIPAAMKDGINDQWVQYKITLTSTGANAPTVDNVITTYVVNARPEFDVPNTTASQISDSSNANWGKVQINYPIRDSDTDTGTVNPGYITPSFEYNIGGGWVSITSGYLNSGALTNKAVQEGTYTSYTAYWDAKSQIPNQYSTTAQIRITLNDNEGANNSTTTTISNITIDTTAPTLSTFTLDSSADTLALAGSDNSNIQYLISNNSDGSADGSNTTYNSWQTVGAVSTTTTIAWTYAPDSTGYESVTIAYRDIYGNTSTTTDVAPYMPNNFYYKDICNTAINDWREFLSWGQYTATTSAAFDSYKVYRSTDGTTYSLLVTNTPYTLNYHVDTTVASTTTYYYKAVTTDSDGDISSYTTPISDLPDGQGGSDSTAPTLTSVTVADYGATWATITWTTDEVANSVVNYGTTASYGSTETVNTMAVSHSVTITGLTPNTEYHYRARSKDIMENEGISSDATFTTSGGPTISNVTVAEVTESTALITWNTNESANSYVYYSVYSNMASASSGGNSTPVATSTDGVYQHNVTLTGLSQNTRYYYYVQSTDTDVPSNTVTDKYDSNTGAYRDFRTTADSRAPVISNVTVAVRSSSALVITWNTDEKADTQVEYGATSNYGNTSTLDSTLTISHVVAISSGLTESTTYHFRARSTDAAGNLATSTDQTTSTTAANEVITVYVGGGGLVSPTVTDTTPPSISNIKVSDIGAFNATVSFETSEAALGLINYGKDTSYGNTAGSDNYQSSHQIKLSGLKLGTEYHFRVKAADKNGNIGESSDQTFTTLFAAEVLEDLVTLENAEQFQEQLESLLESVMPSLVPPFVSNVKIDEINEDSSLVTWKTNIPAHGSLFYAEDSKYDESKDNPYTTEIAENKGKIKDHELKITDLMPSTKYHVQAKSYVFPGAVGKSKDYTFFTKSAKTKPEIINVGNTEFTVAWRTNKETSSFVQYTNTATMQKGQTGTEDKTSQHVVKVENLTPDAFYEVRVYGYDADNNLVEADPLTVRTKKDVIPPKISSININSAFVPYKQDQLQTVISWKTDEPANSLVYFEEGVGVSTDLKNKAGQLDEYVLDHSVIITNFKPATIYRIKISSADEARNITVGPMRTILAPRASESVLEIITKNLEEAFGFLKNLNR